MLLRLLSHSPVVGPTVYLHRHLRFLFVWRVAEQKGRKAGHYFFDVDNERYDLYYADLRQILGVADHRPIDAMWRSKNRLWTRANRNLKVRRIDTARVRFSYFIAEDWISWQEARELVAIELGLRKHVPGLRWKRWLARVYSAVA